MNILEAQADARRVYANGAPGVAISGLVWIITGLVALGFDVQTAMITLFVGGMAINPLSDLASKLVLKRGKPDAGNQMIWLGLLTVPMILTGMFAGYLLSDSNPVWFFALTLMAVGARYLTFKTLYGLQYYVMLGLALLALGFSAIWLGWASTAVVALAGGTIEFFAACFLFAAKPNPTA
jgi:hypothetical protein